MHDTTLFPQDCNSSVLARLQLIYELTGELPPNTISRAELSDWEKERRVTMGSVPGELVILCQTYQVAYDMKELQLITPIVNRWFKGFPGVLRLIGSKGLPVTLPVHMSEDETLPNGLPAWNIER